ncbi:DUF983 domain-containing protein [Paracoccus aerodenitrificans]|uniref:DUF983 domain-containing protein n=1 Tax=Paracoccus aerodenitrificans TaxID=3017781 RepID=UPI0022F07E28|nr:DUF983 domain-containing protein [Paracoccus aerodenitrificans]WBU63506.1 DUF983 domain-containing protein [Paracoccus aerodenitrificans]
MTEVRDSRTAIRRGVSCRCPNCGEGRIFQGYLKVVESCAHCGAPLAKYPAADGPAFFTMTFVMLLLIPVIGFGWVLFEPDPLTFLIVLTVLMTALTLVLLRLCKGAFIGYLWAKNERDRGA